MVRTAPDTTGARFSFGDPDGVPDAIIVATP